MHTSTHPDAKNKTKHKNYNPDEVLMGLQILNTLIHSLFEDGVL
jgi:hypothetical protein